MPCSRRIHVNISAMMLNNFGDDLNPKGRQVSIKIQSSQHVARRWWSAWWTGTYEAKGALNVGREPGPRVRILLMASSMVTYDIEHNSFGIPSFMLCMCGKDRSTIRHNFPGWWDLGITPNRFTWTCGTSSFLKGSATLPLITSFLKYSCTIWGCSSCFSLKMGHCIVKTYPKALWNPLHKKFHQCLRWVITMTKLLEPVG